MKKVLIVEDDLIIAMVIENMVKDLGHEVIGKTNTGEEAVDMALDLKPDIILMDIRLKGEMDGIEAVSKIREKMTVPVIYITGNSDQLNKERAEETGFISLITKPFTKIDLDKSFQLAS